MGGIICHCPGVKDAKIKPKKDISIQHACNVNGNMLDKKHLTKNRITLETMEMLNTKRPRNILEIRRS